MKHIPERVKGLWNTWDIYALMLVSLVIQALLTFLAPYRKCYASSKLKFIMWFLYLSADAVALYTIGLISNNQNLEMLAFWAPFLLLHLGGPDTITALALEDNELWHRHALQLATQVGVTLYVFFFSFAGNKRQLLPPTIFMFINGCIKYIEKACALYFASVDCIRDSLREAPAPTYNKMVQEYYSARDANIPCKFEVKYRPSAQNRHDSVEILDDEVANWSQEWKKMPDTDEMIGFAYEFYEKSKGLLAEAFLSIKDDGEISDFFLNKPTEEAFRILEIELNLMYDVLHTKVLVTNSKLSCFRMISFLSVMASLLIFSFIDKSHHKKIDIGITFALLGSAIILDISAIIMLVLSDWCIIFTSNHGTPKLIKSFILRLLNWSRFARSPFRHRWSESISQHNLINSSIRDHPTWLKIIPVKKIKDVFNNWLYVEGLPLDKHALKFIIKELREKAKLAANDKEVIHEICSARGNLVLQYDYLLVSEYLYRWTLKVDYDESLLIWHLATDICYWTSSDDKKGEIYCKLSKELSDYMSYIMLIQQALVSQVVGRSVVRFEDTMTDIRACQPLQSKTKGWTIEDLRKEFCDNVLQEDVSEISVLITKAKDSQSVFYEACHLSKQLTMFGEDQWEIMSKVWVEMLSYAAVHSSARSHFALLKNGGELITFVWLFMVHLGLREPVQPNRGLRATKLTIYK